MSFVVEAYVAASDRLLWRAKGMDQEDAYDLAVRVDSDPRIEVLLLEIGDADQAVEPVVILDHRT
jgi:hypothetical protein